MLNKINVNIKRLNEKVSIPYYATDFSAGCDLRACLDEDIVIKAHSISKIPTGIAIEIPIGLVGLVYARSGIATKFNVAPVNKVGVIDSDYRGEICVFLCNNSDNDFTVKNGDRIAQLVFTPYVFANFNEVSELDETKRGTGGFGSTGIN